MQVHPWDMQFHLFSHFGGFTANDRNQSKTQKATHLSSILHKKKFYVPKMMF